MAGYVPSGTLLQSWVQPCCKHIKVMIGLVGICMSWVERANSLAHLGPNL